MGIAGLFGWYYKKWKCEHELLIKYNHIQKVNTLYIDYNSLIHPCAKQAIDLLFQEKKDFEIDENEIEECIITNTINYTIYLIQLLCNSQSKCYLYIDGVAPAAKLKQQRERRYKSEFLTNNEKKWDTNQISPGTPFMQKLIYHLQNIKLPNCTIEVNFEPSEAEHKIMRHITKINCNQPIYIYGLDADLIMLSLLNKQHTHISLIRDNSFTEQTDAITSLNIKSLYKKIIQEIKNYLPQNLNYINEYLIKDYIVICFLLGNDFLDHLPSLEIKKNGIHIVLQMYAQTIKFLNRTDMSIYLVNKNDDINMFFLKNLFFNLSKSEQYCFNNLFKPNLCKEEKIQDSDKLIIYYNNIEAQTFKSYKKQYYTFYGMNENNNDIYRNYLTGLQWILGYYNGHSHNNWSYIYKYNNSPFATDLYNYIIQYEFTHNFLNNNDFLSNKPISELEQLFSILPQKSLLYTLNKLDLHKITANFQKFMYIIKDFYPDILFLDMNNKSFYWQSKIFFNKTFDLQLIKQLIIH
jgi:5'-3' exonuclease